MSTIIYLLLMLVSLDVVTFGTIKEPEYYVSVERINVTYIHPDYGYLNATAKRPGRWDYRHYVNMYANSLKTLTNDIKIDFYFYEFRSNEYRRGFVEMHFKLCDLFLKDFFFGPALRANVPVCPIPPGEYYLRNMSIPDLPILRTFPFRKARIFCNGSLGTLNLGYGYTDMEIKLKPAQRKIKKTDSLSTIVDPYAFFV